MNPGRAIASPPGVTWGELYPLGNARMHPEWGDCSNETSHSLCDPSGCNSAVPSQIELRLVRPESWDVMSPNWESCGLLHCLISKWSSRPCLGWFLGPSGVDLVNGLIANGYLTVHT